VRALLDLMRDNEAVVQDLSGRFQELLLAAGRRLKILDPKHGDEELIESLAVVYATLSQPPREPQTLNPKPQTLNSKPCQVCLARRPTFRLLRRIRVVRRALSHLLH